MKRKIDYSLLARLFAVLLLIIVITWIQFSLHNQIDPFASQKTAIINFFCYTFIGFTFHFIKTDFLKKDLGKFNFKIELLLFLIVYLIFSIPLIFTIDFIVILFLNLGISPSIGLIPIQILFGYTLLNLFINK
ncbi:MAG: hypothetical protein K9L74_02500 [Candidatus Izimaplasma sp.]|nr:hypothetical protein [Candidatus Izimaplasma bacterium]